MWCAASALVAGSSARTPAATASRAPIRFFIARFSLAGGRDREAAAALSPSTVSGLGPRATRDGTGMSWPDAAALNGPLQTVPLQAVPLQAVPPCTVPPPTVPP